MYRIVDARWHAIIHIFIYDISMMGTRCSDPRGTSCPVQSTQDTGVHTSVGPQLITGHSVSTVEFDRGDSRITVISNTTVLRTAWISQFRAFRRMTAEKPRVPPRNLLRGILYTVQFTLICQSRSGRWRPGGRRGRGAVSLAVGVAMRLASVLAWLLVLFVLAVGPAWSWPRSGPGPALRRGGAGGELPARVAT